MKTVIPILALLVAAPLAAQQADTIPQIDRRELDGPRIGLMVASGPRAMARLAEKGLQPMMSLFGWHFEQVSRPRGGGPQFVTQQVAVIAGLDQGIAIPSGSFLVGIRTSDGFELGMGPNVSPMGAALAVGIGKSLRTGGVTIPINVAVVISQGAMRTSFLVGYAIRRR